MNLRLHLRRDGVVLGRDQLQLHPNIVERVAHLGNASFGLDLRIDDMYEEEEEEEDDDEKKG